jgi:outer membrane lipoprotein-sorting protein
MHTEVGRESPPILYGAGSHGANLWGGSGKFEGRALSAMNVLRRLPLNRLLALCALVVVLGVSATALASALGSGPVPPAKPLAQAVHDALAGTGGERVQGVSARVQLTNHLLEGANLATGDGSGTGALASSPLLSGASGRLWISKDGHARIELQAERGDTEILYDGHTLSLYDAATSTLYRYTPPAHESGSAADSGASDYMPSSSTGGSPHEVPTVAKIEEAISHLGKHANVSGATPTDVGGRPAYTVRVSPKEADSLLGATELSFDANNGAPLRAAIYSTGKSSPVIELAATQVSYGPVSDSVFAFTPPAGTKIEDIAHAAPNSADKSQHSAEKPKLTTHGTGISTIAVLEGKTSSTGAGKEDEPLAGLPQVSINGTNASELRTELGTVLSFERGGVRYVLAGALAPSAIEEIARGL